MKNKTPVEGNGLNMDDLMNIFASKNPPENTIKRIVTLENQISDILKNMNNKPAPVGETLVASAGPGLDADAMDKLNDLLRRVQSLETRADKTDRHQDVQDETLADHERRIKALESMDLTASPAITGDVDTAAILKQLNLVKSEVNSMRSEFTEYKSKMKTDLE